MAKSATDIIPEQFMDAQFSGQVIAFLKALPVPSEEKLNVLLAWAKATGVSLSSSQRAAVSASGTDSI